MTDETETHNLRSWGELEASFEDWDAVGEAFEDWGAVETGQPDEHTQTTEE